MLTESTIENDLHENLQFNLRKARGMVQKKPRHTFFNKPDEKTRKVNFFPSIDLLLSFGLHHITIHKFVYHGEIFRFD